jgi:hypothetical protein
VVEEAKEKEFAARAFQMIPKVTPAPEEQGLTSLMPPSITQAAEAILP